MIDGRSNMFEPIADTAGIRRKPAVRYILASQRLLAVDQWLWHCDPAHPNAYRHLTHDQDKLPSAPASIQFIAGFRPILTRGAVFVAVLGLITPRAGR
jgi:hypothetical protein